MTLLWRKFGAIVLAGLSSFVINASRHQSRAKSTTPVSYSVPYCMVALRRLVQSPIGVMSGVIGWTDVVRKQVCRPIDQTKLDQPIHHERSRVHTFINKQTNNHTHAHTMYTHTTRSIATIMRTAFIRPTVGRAVRLGGIRSQSTSSTPTTAQAATANNDNKNTNTSTTTSVPTPASATPSASASASVSSPPSSGARLRPSVTSAQLRAQRPRATEKKSANPDSALDSEKCGPEQVAPAMVSVVNEKTGERLGPRGLEPTRYGDWEAKGRCWDF